MANTFDLATGVVTFKGDFDKFEQDIAKAEKQVAGLYKSLDNGSFRMAASAAAGINRDMEKAHKAAKRMMDEIRLGKMGVLLRDAATGMSKFVASMRMVAVGGMAAGGSALGLASVASPVAADTLQKSLKLAAATIGKDFIPLIAEVSFAIQDAAAAWERLDPAIKSNVAEITKMVAIAGAASVALLGLGKVLSFIKSHPVLSMFAAGVGVGTLVNNSVNKAGANQFAGGQGDINGIAWKDVLNDGRMAELQKMGPNAAAAAEKDWRQKKAEYEAAAADSNNYQKGFGGGIISGLDRASDWSGGRQKELIEKATRAQAEWTKSEMRWSGIAGKAPKDATVGDTKNKGKGNEPPGPHMIAGSGPSSYTSLQEFYRSFNVAATSGDVFDQKMLDIAQKSLQEFQQMNQKIGALVPAQ